MDSQSPILSKFNEFKQFLIDKQLYDEKSLKELLNSCETDDNESQLKAIVEDIETKDRQFIDKFAELTKKSEFNIKDDEQNTVQSDNFAADVKTLLVTRFKDLLMTPKACGEELLVAKASKIKSNKYGDVYPMKSHPRGYCLIINNQLFNGLPFRTGSRADADRLSDVFSQLDFQVFCFTNKTIDDMTDLFKNLSRNQDLKEHDALAVVILSHGCDDGIYGTDGRVIPVDTILEYFNNKNCISLIGKPKMFFLSACRGAKIDPGIDELTRSIKFMSSCSLSGSARNDDRLTTWSDIFIYYSTISGYASLRNITSGSWFGYELAHGLAEFAHREHLHDLVTIRVADMLQQRSSQVMGHSAKQAMESQTRGSVKKLYFNPGC